MNGFQITDPVVNTYVLLLNTSDILSRYAEVQLSKLNITPTQYMVLMTLSTINQPPTLTELGQRLFRAKNGLTTVIDNMEQDGLVKRVRDGADRRAIRIIATQKGTQLLESVRRPSRELVHRMMSCFDKEDIAQLSKLLQRVRGHVLRELEHGNGRKSTSGLST